MKTLFVSVVLLAMFPTVNGVAQIIGSVCPVHSGGAGAQSSTGTAPINFPNEGEVNALIIFAQFEDDNFEHCYTVGGDVPYAPWCSNNTAGYQSWTDDLATEWPASLSKGPTRELPVWARGESLLALPTTPPTNFAAGSVSQYYDMMSSGRLIFRGHVLPEVYIIDEQDTGMPWENTAHWYQKNPGGFPNGAVRLSHEILSSTVVQNYVNSLDASVFDRYDNGDGSSLSVGASAPDGDFDMIILLFRFSRLSTSSGNAHSPLPYSAVSSLGGDSNFGNAFSSSPLTLGGFNVIDNYISGSGVIGAVRTKKQAVAIIAHEIGHRHFGGGHPPDFNSLAVMDEIYGPMSVDERMRLGWIDTITEIDLSTQSGAFADQLTESISDGGASEILRIHWSGPGRGDALVEARTWSNYWDAPPSA